MLTAKEIREYKKSLSHSGQPLDVSDPYYVANLHGKDGYDVILRLQEAIEDTDGTGLYYFTGQRGTGKSTELRRLETGLNGNSYRCIRFDALNYLNDTQPIDAHMLMLIVAAGIGDWIVANYPERDATKESPLTRFCIWLNTEINLEKIDLHAPGVKLALNLKPIQENVSAKIHKLSDQQRLHREIINFISEMCTWISERENRRVVIVVDSLENLRGNPLAGKDQERLFASVLDVFADRIELIKVPDVHIVYSVPPYLCLLANIRPQVNWLSLASVRVYADPVKAPRQPRDEGLDMMRELLTKRLPRWREILDDESFQRLALLSGGDLRQFIVRLMVDVLHLAQYTLDRLPLKNDDPIIEDIASACASEMLQLTVTEEWPLLRTVAERHNILADNREQIKILAHLLDTKVILNYRNGKDWYDLHPTLWGVIDPVSPTTIA